VLGTFAVAPALGLYQHLIKKEKIDPLKIAEGVALTTLGSLGLTCESLAVVSISANEAAVWPRIAILRFERITNYKQQMIRMPWL
jgi:hypothetical protein